MLDKEALRRATSVYFTHLVIPMLPRLLCENLCSLNSNVERLAYSCFYRMRTDGTLVEDYKPRVCRSVIKSCAKWYYELVQEILDKKITSMDDLDEEYRTDRFTFDQMAGDCFKFNEIAQNRRKIRFNTGSVNLINPEYYFKLNEDKIPKEFGEVEKIESKSLIEEYMLLANLHVANFLKEHCKDKAVIRTQLPPDEDKLQSVVDYCAKIGAEVDFSSSLSIHQSFDKLNSDPEKKDLYLCAMKKFFSNIKEANYLTIGDLEPEA